MHEGSETKRQLPSEIEELRKRLEERLKFETLLADLSARFINVSADLLDAEIKDVQRRICEWLDLDVSTLWQLSADHSGPLLLTHLYAPKDFPPVPELMDGKEVFPWCVEKLFQRENVILSRVTDAPAAAARDLDGWRHYGIKSVLTLPLSAGGGPVYGALSFSSIRKKRDWPIEFVSRLQLVAEIFANALARRRAQETIRKSEAKYRRLHESMMDGFVLVSMEGMITDYNESYRQMTGYAPEELLSLTYRDLTPEKWHDFEQKIIEQQVLIQQYSEVYEKEYRKKDGTIFPVELRTFLLKDETGSNTGMWAIVRDVSERKLAEEVLDERLRFERLLSDLSARFTNVSPDQVNAQIECGLRQILEFFKVERCALLQVWPGKDLWHATHAAVTKAGRSVPAMVEFPVSLLPYAYDKLVHKRQVHLFSRLDDLPVEANVDRQTNIEMGIRSCLYIPIMIGEPVVHVIALDSVVSEHTWPEEFIPRLRLIGEIFLNALERARIRLQLEERLRFERLVSDLSAQFVNLPSDDVDAEINKGLRCITEFFDVDRCTIAVFSEDRTRLVRVFEYHSAEAEPGPESFSKEQMPWYLQQLLMGNTVIVTRVDDLPDEAEKERRVCLARGIKSVLSVPLKSGGIPLAACALVSTQAERLWPEELVQRFQFVSEVFANALQHRRAETMLRASEEKFRQFFSHTPEYCYIISPGGTILDVNDYALKALGYEKEDLVGKPVETIYAPESLPRMRELSKRWREYGEIANEEMTVITRDGERRTVLINMGAVRDNDGAIIQTASVQTDITERKRAEDEAQEARRELSQLERVTRMGELTASLAHELNQPLAAILTSAQAAVRFLQSDTPDLNRFRTILQNIIQDDKRAADVITSLRSMMKREQRAKEPLNMNTVLDDVLNLFNSEAIIRNVTIERDFDLSLPPILGDKNQLQQVVLNLIMNAAEAMSERPREHDKRKIVLRTGATHRGIQVAVRDFGPGVDPAKLADIWQPFFTTKHTGMGMGLSVSRSIIQAHGGHISAENLPDGGAMFSFELPVISKQ